MTIDEVIHEIDLYLEQLVIEGNQGKLAWNILMELKEKIQKKGRKGANKMELKEGMEVKCEIGRKEVIGVLHKE